MDNDRLVFLARTVFGDGRIGLFDQSGKLETEGSGGVGTRYSLAEAVPHEAWTTSERKHPDLLLVPGEEGGMVANNFPLFALRAIGILAPGNSVLTPISWKNYYTGMGIRNVPIPGNGVYATGYAQGGTGYGSDDPDDVNNPLAQSVVQKVMMDRFFENPVLRNLANGYDTDLDSDDGKPISGTPIADIAAAVRRRNKRGQWTWHDLIMFLRQAAKEFGLAYDAGDIDYNPLLESGVVDEAAFDVLTARGVAGLSNKVIVPEDEDFELLRKRLIEERKAAGRSYDGDNEDIVDDYMFDKLVDYLWQTAVQMQTLSFGSKPSAKEKLAMDMEARRCAEAGLKEAGFNRPVSSYRKIMAEYGGARVARRKEERELRTAVRVESDADAAAKRQAIIKKYEKHQASVEKTLSKEARKAYLDKWEKRLTKACEKAIAAVGENEEDLAVVKEHYARQFARLKRKRANIDEFCSGKLAAFARNSAAERVENYKGTIEERQDTIRDLSSASPLRTKEVDEAEEAVDLYDTLYYRRMRQLGSGHAEVVTLSGKASDIASVNDMIRGKQASALDHMNQKLLKTGVQVGDEGWRAKDLKERCIKYFALRNNWSKGRISGRNAFFEAFGLDPSRIPSDREIKELHDDYQGFVDRAERHRRIVEAVDRRFF